MTHSRSLIMKLAGEMRTSTPSLMTNNRPRRSGKYHQRQRTTSTPATTTDGVDDHDAGDAGGISLSERNASTKKRRTGADAAGSR